MTINSSPVTDTNSQSVDIKSVIDLVAKDMHIVNQCIETNLNSDVALINQLGAYIIQAGGKRLRPVALLLAAKATETDPVATNTDKPSDQVLLAAIIEFIHTATLLHLSLIHI